VLAIEDLQHRSKIQSQPGQRDKRFFPLLSYRFADGKQTPLASVGLVMSLKPAAITFVVLEATRASKTHFQMIAPSILDIRYTNLDSDFAIVPDLSLLNLNRQNKLMTFFILRLVFHSMAI
jgi:hypothetical protein